MLVCIVLLIGLVTLFACNKGNVADKDGQTKVIVKIQDEDGSIYKENVVFSDLFTLSLQKEGYTGRLYRDADFLKPLTKDSKVKNGDTVYVKWTINKYTVTFMDGEKVLAAFTNVPHGETVTAPEVPKKDGKTFIKWDTDFSKVTSDLTINAVYDVDTFTVTFKDGEKVLETQTVEYEAAATAPDTARLSPPEGMHFAKWDKDFSKVTEDIEVSAVYEINFYTVIFKNGETTLKIEKVKHGDSATPPNNPPDTPTAKFVGWGESFDNVTSDLIVNAKLEKRKYTLTFINFDGTTVYTAAVEYGAPIVSHFETADNDVAYDDTILDYVGWYDKSDTEKTIIDDFSELTMPTHDLTYALKLRLMDSAIGEFTVNTPADFTYVENNSAVFTVNGTPYAGVTYKYIWTINKDNVFYKTEETTESSLTLQNLAAGKYMANVKIVASMENCGSVEKDFSAGETLIVSRADISDITVTGVTMTYGDKTAKIGISGLRADDVITYKEEREEEFKENVDLSVLDCGEYDYYVRISRGDNYNPYTSGKITVTINKAEVSATVTPDDDTLTYGDNLPSLTAKIGEETYTIESGKYELHLGMTSITGDVANNVGTYNIENVDISVLREKYPEKNYDIKLTTVGAITINQAKLTVTVSLDKTELTYGEDSPIISYTFSGLKSSDKEDDFTITKTELAEKLDVGTYTASVTLSGDKTKFYNINVIEADFIVKQRDATITIDKVKNITYGDKVPDLSATVDGVLKGDSLSYTLNPNYEVGNKPGDYTASVEFNPEAAENKNYAITATGTTFTVGKKDLTIKLKNTATVAVGKTYKVEAEHLEKIGLVAGDTVTRYVTITKDVAGTYYADDFDKSNLVVTNADCYVISYEMSVTFIEVTFAIDFADVTLTYDGQPHGVLVKKTDASKHYTITYGTTENDCTLNNSPEYTNAGTYKIYFKVVDNDTLAEHVGYVTLTISPAKVIVTVNDVTITYGDTPEFSYEATGLLNGDTLSGDADYSGAGTDAGDYVISVSGLTASDNYAVTVKTGTLTINKKTAKADWTIAENYVYSPDGQTLPTATYDGKTANLKFTKDGKACEFKNAGTYTVTVADNNYILTNNEKTIVIEKATYADPAISLTDIYYDPNKTLGKDYKIEGITWVNPDEVPVCTKTEYAAKYNKDPENYDYLDTTVTLVLQKATVTLAENLFEFNYDGASHEIGTTVRYNNIEVTEPYTLTFGKNMFSAAGTHKTTATLTADNYDLPKNTYVYVKVKGVKVGNNYYTIEDALDVATSGTIFVLNDTAFATQEIAGVLYDNEKFKTVKTGVTLLLPFNENDTVGHIGAGEDGSANYKATAALTGTAKLYKTLVIPEGIEVIVNGKLIVGAQTGTTAAGGTPQNGIRGNYCEIRLDGTITLKSATLEVYGYIKGNGKITANNSTVIENLYLTGWLGGSESAGRYIGDGKLLTNYALSPNIKNPVQFPFSHYELRSVQLSITLHKGSKHQGYVKIATGNSLGGLITAQINEAWLTFVSSDNNESSGLVRMKSSDAKVVKTFKGGRVGIETYGSVEDGYTAVSVKVATVTLSMASEKVFFPICGKTDIVIKSGTFTQKYKYKLMPGSTLTIENGATLNQNGSIVVYTGDFKDVSDKYYPSGLGDAKFTVDGTLNINGSFGGKVLSTTAGKVVVGANATITDVYSQEGKGDVDGVTTKYTPLDKAMTTKSLVFVNADGMTVAGEKGKTYTYNGTSWQ